MGGEKKMAKIRILRILEYVGEEEFVWRTLRHGGVPVNGEIDVGNISIKSGLVGHQDYVNNEPDNNKEEGK